MIVRFSGVVGIPVEDIENVQLIKDCTISTLWSHLNDGGLVEPIIERLNLVIEPIQELNSQ